MDRHLSSTIVNCLCTGEPDMRHDSQYYYYYFVPERTQRSDMGGAGSFLVHCLHVILLIPLELDPSFEAGNFRFVMSY
jgi:hypothetical protein